MTDNAHFLLHLKSKGIAFEVYEGKLVVLAPARFPFEEVKIPDGVIFRHGLDLIGAYLPYPPSNVIVEGDLDLRGVRLNEVEKLLDSIYVSGYLLKDGLVPDPEKWVPVTGPGFVEGQVYESRANADKRLAASAAVAEEISERSLTDFTLSELYDLAVEKNGIYQEEAAALYAERSNNLEHLATISAMIPAGLARDIVLNKALSLPTGEPFARIVYRSCSPGIDPAVSVYAVYEVAMPKKHLSVFIDALNSGAQFEILKINF